MTEIWLFMAIKGIGWLMKLKIPSMAVFRNLKISPRTYLSRSLNFAFFCDGFLLRFFHQGYKEVSHTPLAFILLLSSLQRNVLNVLVKIQLGSNASL